MDSYIDLKDIVTEELKHVDLDRVNVTCSPPDVEPQRQYYFMAKCRQIVKSESERLGRPLYACIQTFGCQMNARDSEKLLGILTQIGYVSTQEESEADFVIYNTCTVRDNANQRVYGRLGFLNSLKRQRPHLKIALCGCMMQEQTVIDKIRKSYRFVDLIFGTHNLFKFAQLLLTMFENRDMIVDIWQETDQIVEELPVNRKYPYKSGINIMFGCNNFCSYCIVPYVRGRERSRDPQEIVQEIRQLVADGVVEVMLLGQNVNSYGNDLDTGYHFPDLLEDIDKIPGDYWIRFISSHPKDATPRLFDVMAKCSHVANQLHLPVQSGNNRVLEAMNRRYTKETYLELIRYARSVMPGLVLTSDIIIGFPGETEAEAMDTVALVEEVGFDALFTFLYSPRPGTKAAELPDPAAREDKQRWFDKLLEVQNDHSAKIHAGYVGKTVRALVDGESGDEEFPLSARTEGNRLVRLKGDKALVGRFLDVKITGSNTWALYGEPV